MVIIVMGVAGSGKSTVGERLARSLGWMFADADAFHPSSNIEKMSQGVPLTDEDRRPWVVTLKEAIDGWLKENRNVVLACSALTKAIRRILIIDEHKVKLVYLKGPYELIRARIAHRTDHFMREHMLASQFEILEEPVDAVTVDAGEPPDALVRTIQARLRLTKQEE